MIKVTPSEIVQVMHLFDNVRFALEHGNSEEEIEKLIREIEKMKFQLKLRYMESTLASESPKETAE